MAPVDDGDAPYVRIADDLRRQIEQGELAPGERLPSEQALSERYKVARPTAGKAIGLLRSQGLVRSAPKSGTYVREQPALHVRSSDRYHRGATPPVATDAVREGKHAEWGTPASARIRATQEIADRLGIQAGDFVMTTTYPMYRVDGRALQTSVSWEPFAVVGGTPIEEAEAGEVRGVIQRMALIGLRVHEVIEDVLIRPATPEERRTFELAYDQRIKFTKRTHFTEDGTPVETADILRPAEGTLDRYRIIVRDAPES